MTIRRTLIDLLHDATHRVPGVPEHRPQPGAGRVHHVHSQPVRSPGGRLNDREPRVLVAWQRRIAAFVARQ